MTDEKMTRRGLFGRAAPVAALAVIAPAAILAEPIPAPRKRPDLSHVEGCAIPEEAVISAGVKDAAEWVARHKAQLNLPDGAEMVCARFDATTLQTIFVWSHPDFELRHEGCAVRYFDYREGWQKPTPEPIDDFIDDDQYGIIHKFFPRAYAIHPYSLSDSIPFRR